MKVDGTSPGLLLVLSAPSGAGKTTLARLFVAQHPEACFSVSATTRTPRGAEREGVDYHFVTREQFAELVARDAFAEWADVHGQRYGTLRSTVEESLAAGRIAVFDIDVQGGAQVKARWPEQAVTVFVLPPSLEELERRLRARSTDADAAIARRLGAARSEIDRGLAQYDYVLVNDDLATARRQLEAIVTHERARFAGRRDERAREIAESLQRSRVDAGRWLR